MAMIDTALENLDVLCFDDKILGTTGVLYVFVMFHFWFRVKINVKFNNSIKRMSFLGTMRTSMVPKIIRPGKYDI